MVPLTRFLFGDDVSQSTKPIEEPEKLKHKITKKPLQKWKFSARRVRDSFGKKTLQRILVQVSPL